jgi:hypothetical protein
MVAESCEWTKPRILNKPNGYALTDGHFRISVGPETLLRYTREIISRWELSHEDADYQVAEFALDVLALVPAAISTMPAFFENIVRDEALFRELRKLPAKHSREKVPAGVARALKAESSLLRAA